MVLDRPEPRILKVEHCLPFVERAYQKMGESSSNFVSVRIPDMLDELNKPGGEFYYCENRSEMALQLTEFLRRHDIPAAPVHESPEDRNSQIVAILLAKYRD